jgi:drug/metabolite transporter (DMT)-like permease
MRFKGRELALVIFSFAVIYIIWGTTFLGVRLAINSIPPILMAGLRYFTAGAILLLLVLTFTKVVPPTWQQIKNAVFGGSLLVGGGTGGIAWALQYVDTGITAMIVAGQPLVTLLMMWIILKRPPVLSSYLGILLGLLGMALLVFQDQITTQKSSIWGVIISIASMISWGYGSVITPKLELPKGQSFNTAIQMLGGGSSLLVLSLLIGDYKGFHFYHVTSQSAWAFAYLVIFGSILGFSCFNYLIRRISADKVSTSTYINPIVAMILGWAVLGEVITQQSIIAALIMLLGVFFINIDLLTVLKKRKIRASRI